MKPAVLALALIASPALAQESITSDNISQAVREHDRKAATRWEIAYQLLNAIDAGQTIDCVNRYPACHEANPLFGRRPSTGKIIGIKAGGALIHWLVFAHLRERDPAMAKRFATISVVIQGTVVGLNMRQVF